MPTVDLPLKDIHLPETIGWWPPAMGWWIAALLLTALLVFGVWLYRRLTRKTAIKAAKKLLLMMEQNNEQDNLQQLTELSSLLRRAAISLYPRTEIASLSGREWLLFLDRSMVGNPFSEGAGQILKDAHFRKTAPDELNISELYRLCETWLNAQTKQLKTLRKK